MEIFFIILGIIIIFLILGFYLNIVWDEETSDDLRKKDPLKKEYQWKICKHCRLAYIPKKKNQIYCSWLCEFLEHTKG